MTQVFLNYRAADDPFGVTMLDQVLSARFGPDAVFLASKSIPPGADWEREMFQAVADSAALLVIMGHNWLDARNERGQRRLDDPEDFVRREIITAEELGKRVIPVRLGVPRLAAGAYPPELRVLAGKQDIEIRFRSARIDVEHLVAKLREHIPALRRAAPGEKSPAKFAVHGERIGQVTQAERFTVHGDFNAGLPPA
ncbi:toll/interleukin-1 receptor domain-containing protein [Amycolatopsis sacchari]|uniref:TIR domain-containing protein n=1 Tax=Amycolatopsis sacchari TaxID=115433 RepID=A0A1I3M0C8_9PSEU|nr:toll/interleukin-1 receptor domain-containing protein [Amycolatopsis sacchari]SFI90418.1 TIR domain-containing protein [Amycolatopsis sacchari]